MTRRCLLLLAFLAAACGDSKTVEVDTSCNELISTCDSSAMWTGYFTPFTADRCVEVLECTKQLYDTDCNMKMDALIECLGTISSSDTCDSKCMSLMLAVQTNCPCPSSCGVSCGG
jgi:hypothetical protein